MKQTMLIHILSILPLLVSAQINDSILPPPKVQIPAAKNQIKEQKIDVSWATPIIEKINTISFVELIPVCNNEKNDLDCYEETVIIHTVIMTLEDSIKNIKKTLEFDQDRMINWTEIDNSDYTNVIEATFGKRESSMVNMCYNPRHAIIFRDTSDTIFAIYEICFECSKSKIAFDFGSGNTFEDFINIYDYDYIALKNLFKKYQFLK